MPLPNFMGGLGGMLFPGGEANDPQAAAARNQAMLMMGLGMMGAGSRPGATLGSSLFDAYQGAAGTYQGAMQTAFRNTMAKQENERQVKQEDRLQKAQELEDKRTERLLRQDSAQTAGRISSGISSAKDPVAYWNLVRGMPEVQQTLSTYGIDPNIATPEQLQGAAQQLQAAASVGMPTQKPQPVQLKAVVGPNGKPVLVPEEQAIGREPAYAPKGKGFSMTLPDGTVVEMGGEGSQVGAGELAKPTINSLQETIVNSTNRLDRLNQTLKTYNPEFLRAAGVAKAATTRVQDFLGMDVPEDRKQYLKQYAEFQANAAQDFTQTLKELSGVAVNAHELKRAEATAPSGNDISPAEFEAKARATTKFVTRAIMRANWALKNGIGVKSVDDLAKTMPLEGIDAVYEQRANEIWQELGGTPEVKAQAIQRANQEFGLAR